MRRCSCNLARKPASWSFWLPSSITANCRGGIGHGPHTYIDIYLYIYLVCTIMVISNFHSMTAAMTPRCLLHILSSLLSFSCGKISRLCSSQKITKKYTKRWGSCVEVFSFFMEAASASGAFFLSFFVFGQTLQNNFHNVLEAVSDNELLITPKTRFAKETASEKAALEEKK